MNTKHKINLDTVLTILYMLFGVALVTANCISNKLMDFSLFGLNANITVGVVAYPFTFLITDIIGEFWGKDKAKVAVWGGFLA